MTDVLPGMPGFYGGPAQAAAARDAFPPPRDESPSCSGGSFDSDVAFVACVLDKRGCVDLKKAARALEAAAEAACAESCGAADCCDSAVDLADDGVAALQRLNEMHRKLERFRPCTAPPAGFDEGEASDIYLPTGDDDEETSDGDSWGFTERLGAHAPDLLVPTVATAAAAPAPTPAQADPAAAPLKRQQRACVVMRAVLAAAPPVAAAPAAAPKPAKPRALAPKAAGIAKKATASKYPPPAAPVYGIGGSSPLAEDELVEFVIGIEPHSCDTNGRNKLGYSWAKFIRRAKDTDELPLWKLRICGPSSKVPRKTYERILENGELERIRAKIARGA